MARTNTSPLATLLTRERAKGPLCSVSIVAAVMTPAERDLLDQVMQKAIITGRDITDTLAEMGHRVPSNTVNRHRRKECACWHRPDGWKRGGRPELGDAA